MDSLISRQAAIDALADDLSYYGSGDERAFGMSRAIGIIEKLPLAQPQSCKDAVSKADVLEIYSELYDVFDDNKEIKNELHKIYDKINALQAAQPQRWIPVTERLPEYGTGVVTINKDDEYEINHVIDEEDGEWFFDGAVAWMPLPEVFKGEQE